MELRRVEVGERSHDLHATDADGIVVDEIFVENVYRMERWMVEGRTVLDIGGHIGCFAVWAYLAGAARVITVEPDSDKLLQLRPNVEGLSGVEIMPYAVAEGPSHQANWLPSRLTGTGGAHLSDTGVETVSTINLDDLLAEAGPVAFLKMDIEGGEFELDFTPVRLAQIERLAMEVHGSHTYTDYPVYAKWQRLVAQLAESGSVTTLGHPARGGSLFWTRN